MVLAVGKVSSALRRSVWPLERSSIAMPSTPSVCWSSEWIADSSFCQRRSSFWGGSCWARFASEAKRKLRVEKHKVKNNERLMIGGIIREIAWATWNKDVTEIEVCPRLSPVWVLLPELRCSICEQAVKTRVGFAVKRKNGMVSGHEPAAGHKHAEVVPSVRLRRQDVNRGADNGPFGNDSVRCAGWFRDQDVQPLVPQKGQPRRMTMTLCIPSSFRSTKAAR